MLELGRFQVNATHRVKVKAPRCVVRVELTDPRTGEPVAVEGAEVCLVGSDGAAVSSKATTDRDGEASVLIVERGAGAVMRIELPPLFDFEDQVFVDEAALEALDSRPLLRLPEVWRSDRQAALFDDLGGRAKGGRLPALVPDGQGTEDSPWILRLDHGWTAIDVGLSFHDTQTHARSFIDQGVMVEAFSGATRVGGATLVGDDGHHRLRLFDAASPESLSLRFRTPAGTYLELTNRSIPLRRLETLPSGTVTPLGQQLERYALPEQWLSRGQLASLDGGKTAQAFEDIAAALLEGGKTVEFDLDDVLLVDDQGRPINVKGAVGVSVFGGDFVVKRPRADDPQHSEIVIDRALLRGRDVYSVGVSVDRPFAATRVIRRGRRFYELDGSRTTGGPVVGVRKAVREAHPVIREPFSTLERVSRHRADFHVFDGVGVIDLDGEPHALRVVLVHVSVRLRPEIGFKPDDLEATVLGPARAIFALAADRWSGDELGAHLTARPSDAQRIYLREPSLRRATKLVFHFPTVVAGKAMTSAFLVTRPPKEGKEEFRAHAVLGSVTLNILKHLKESKEEQSETETGEVLRKNTVAHEMGHVLGLPDEYIEVPGFRQPSRGLMHAFDANSIMNGGSVPMLRHFAVIAHALVTRMEQSAPFEVYSDTRSPSAKAGRVHRYSLPDDEGPFADLAQFKYGPPGAEYDGIIGRLGDDFTFDPSVGTVEGIVVLSPRIHIRLLGAKASDSITIKEDEAVLLHNLQQDLSDWGIANKGLPPVILQRSKNENTSGPRRLLVRLDPRLSYKNRLSADVRVKLLFPTMQSGRPPFSADENRVEMHQHEGSRLARYLAALPMRQPPALLCSGGGSNLEFKVNGKVVSFQEVAQGASATNTYVARLATKNGGFTPLPPAQVASNLATAINDPKNGLAGLVTAEAHAAEVQLTSTAGELEVRSTSQAAIRVRAAQPDAVTAPEFTRLASLVSEILGMSFEVEA